MQSEIRAQIFRMLAELELGARLLHCGRQVEYGRELEGKTPDWIDEADGLLVEVVTAGPTQDMYKHADRGEIWCGFVETETSSLARDRFHDALLSKVTTYQELVVRRSLRYVIAVCGSMETDASPYDGRRVILQERMFNDRNHLSGVIYFNVTPFRSFDYIANPSADRPVNLDGVNLLPENLIADWGGTDQS